MNKQYKNVFPKATALLFILCVSFSVNHGYAQSDSDKSGLQQIEYVDNTKGIVVINDQEYRMRLGMKVTDSNKRILNRYALKVGQNVRFSQSFEKQTYYIDSVMIMRK